MQKNNTEHPNPEGDEIFSDPGDAGKSSEERYFHLESMEPKIPEVDSGPAWVDTADQAGEKPEGTPVEPPISESKPEDLIEPEGKTSQFLRNFIRWTAGLLIIFGIGLIAGIYVLYRPTVERYERNIQQLEADLTTANGQITKLDQQVKDLESQIASLQPIKEKNEELLAEQQGLNLHIAILDARVDVANAQIALYREDKTQARITLNQTSTTLTTINGLLKPELQEAVSALKQRLDLVMDEIDEDAFAAQSDLEVLEMKLLQLQDALFGE